jgi:predicted permease
MSGQRSPAVMRALLAWLLPADTREFVLGDLEELYERRRTRRGRVRASAWYCRATISVLARGGGVARGRWGGRVMLGGLVLDARSAVRSLRRTPSFTALASGTLAIGLGVTIAVYAMADQLMLRPPPGVHDVEGVGYIVFGAAADPDDVAYMSPTDIADFRAATGDIVDEFTAFTAGPAHVRAAGARPVTAQIAFTEGPLFELLGVRASRGRLPGADELGTAAPWAVAVISERLWSTLFARDPAAIGGTVHVNGQPMTVVGVTADGFTGLQREAPVDVWVPASALIPVLDFSSERLNSRQAALYPHVVARLRPGMTAQAASIGLVAAAERIVQSLPEGESTLQGNIPRLHMGVHIAPDSRLQIRQSLRLLAAVVGLVLFVACANVANLLLFRALRGRHDVLVRRALGASRTRIVVQQMMGNVLLAMLGMVAGLGAAWAMTRLFAGQKLLGMPAFDSLDPDGRLLLFAAAAAVASGLLAGAVPAWVASRAATTSPAHAQGTRSTGRHERLRAAMTIVQLTASLALTVAATQLMRTVGALYAIDPGYATAGVYVVPLNVPETQDQAARLAAYARAEQAAAGVPGVERVAIDMAGPLVPRLRGPVTRSNGAPADRTNGIITFLTPDWFDLMEVRLLRGRGFTAEDRGPAGTGRVILSEGLARTIFGAEEPIGRTIRAFGRRHDVEVIGVVEDIRYSRILSEPEPVIYHPWSEPFFLGTTVLLYRARDDGAATAAAVREALTRADPLLAVEKPLPLTARVDEQLADHRLFAQLLAFLSALAALLAGVGLYGVVAYGVADRTREFGIRAALGATGSGIMRLVMRQTAVMIGVGAVFGIAAAALLARGLADRLHGVGPLDPLSFAFAILALACIALLACAGPARSATRVDPMTALRQD